MTEFAQLWIVHQEQLIRALGHRPTLSPRVQREWQQLETADEGKGVKYSPAF